ncbi:Acylamino-acid-releasing enzyme, putative isoform 3 [Hibiscus syriacus]|uniref:Acylamino-acid-releasing enzyme, putative isoform 3 n=1 Tax=Hibiscus syriacus TaxID=106335 RepID=A0A6A2ZVP6_HIBSY|nr:Acylamino-acid-releasing enzyme, putative isoform 3 [Hibiscus syriacus]
MAGDIDSGGGGGLRSWARASHTWHMDDPYPTAEGSWHRGLRVKTLIGFGTAGSDLGLQVESKNEVFALYPLNAEFTRPLWVFGMNSYEFIKSDAGKTLIACTYRKNGRSYLGILDDAQGSFSLLDIPFTDIENIELSGVSAVQPSSVAKVTLDGHKLNVVDFKIVWSSSLDCLKYEAYFSRPELIEFPTEVPGQNAYTCYYPPKKSPLSSLPGRKATVAVGKSRYDICLTRGPTAETRGVLNLSIHYWTSRGWAFVDVNYCGSTGMLWNDFWGGGELSMLMTVAAVLAALAFRDTFKAGASLYGVADLSLLRAEMHKFESHYNDKLVGEEKAYFERSPINFVDKFSCPIILFQGLEDKVVPPDQSRKIYRALKEKCLPVALWSMRENSMVSARLITSNSQ